MPVDNGPKTGYHRPVGVLRQRAGEGLDEALPDNHLLTAAGPGCRGWEAITVT